MVKCTMYALFPFVEHQCRHQASRALDDTSKERRHQRNRKAARARISRNEFSITLKPVFHWNSLISSSRCHCCILEQAQSTKYFPGIVFTTSNLGKIPQKIQLLPLPQISLFVPSMIDEKRWAVGMLDPLRDKTRNTRRGEKKGPHLCPRLSLKN